MADAVTDLDIQKEDGTMFGVGKEIFTNAIALTAISHNIIYKNLLFVFGSCSNAINSACSLME